MATLRAWVEQHKLTAKHLKAEQGGEWEDWAKIQFSSEYWARWNSLEEARRLEGFFTRDEFHQAL